jgi:predicted GIY-YIG superfamily endonuclease
MEQTDKPPGLREVVTQAFLACHEGRSTEDVVIDDALNGPFIVKCRAAFPSASAFDFNWALYNLRKASALGPVATVRASARHAGYLHAAEIAARLMEDSFGLTIDRVLCHPDRRAEFDAIALGIAPGVPAYLLRKASLRLRKGRRLRPELIKRVASWGTTVFTSPAGQLLADPKKIAAAPGVYIFFDPSGYLYIGEAGNLRQRVSQHLDHSDRKALAHYLWEKGVKNLSVELHAFDPASEGRKATSRKAYEAELIRSRRPRFNIQCQP